MPSCSFDERYGDSAHTVPYCNLGSAVLYFWRICNKVAACCPVRQVQFRRRTPVALYQSLHTVQSPMQSSETSTSALWST